MAGLRTEHFRSITFSRGAIQAGFTGECYDRRVHCEVGMLLRLALMVMMSIASLATTTVLALNAPTCAQEMENSRRVCLQSCANTPLKARCSESCSDSKKLLSKMAECEERRTAPRK